MSHPDIPSSSCHYAGTRRESANCKLRKTTKFKNWWKPVQPAGTISRWRLREPLKPPITCSLNLALKMSARPRTLPVKFPLSQAQAHMTPSLRAAKCRPCTPSQWLTLLLTVDTLKLLRMCLLGRKADVPDLDIPFCLSVHLYHSLILRISLVPLPPQQWPNYYYYYFQTLLLVRCA